MSPQKQAAQIANAQKSHGPATEAGRARSSQNSIRHSLCSKKYFIVPEERPEFDLYYDDLLAALAPEGTLESKLAESIIMDEWRLTRARQVENQIFCRVYMSAKPEEQFISSAETWLAHSRELATLTLYEQRINRVLTRNKAEFASLQGVRLAAALPAGGTSVPHPDALPVNESQSPEAPVSAAQPAEFKQETAASDQPAGFVHSSAVPAPASEPEPQTSAAKRPVGFVRSSSPIAPPEEPATPVNEPETVVEPLPSPPAARRHACLICQNRPPIPRLSHSFAIRAPPGRPPPPRRSQVLTFKPCPTHEPRFPKKKLRVFLRVSASECQPANGR